MVLNSLTFIVFLCVVAVVYYLINSKFQNTFLLFASFGFYVYGAPQYALLLVLTIVISFFGVVNIETAKTEKSKNLITVALISYLVLVLFVFKYAGVLSENMSLILPLGISFYSFQLIGYILDVRNNKISAERNFIDFALFISFFPQIISGPIGRAPKLVPQYKKARLFCYYGVVDGLLRIVYGAFKKVVVANGIGIIVDGYFNSLGGEPNLSLTIAMVLYFFQIYADFSGYSDMAIGSAKVVGITLDENFAVPYLSKNYSSFWSRWHISLSSFLQDYIFIPLVWSRWFNKLFFKKTHELKPPHFLVNILIVFIISGMWHGATLNFVVWGALQGVFRIGEELVHKWRKRPIKIQNKNLDRLRNASKILLVNLLWGISLVFFRAKTLSEAVAVFKNTFNFEGLYATVIRFLTYSQNGVGNSGTYYLLFFGILGLSFLAFIYFEFMLNRLHANGAPLNPLTQLKQPFRLLTCWFMTIAIAAFHLISISGSAGSSFIYMGY